MDPWGAPLPIPTYTKKTETSTDSDDSGNSDSNSDSTEDNTEENTDENTEDNTEDSTEDSSDSTEDAKTDEETSTTEDKEDTVSSLFHKVNDKIENIAGGIHKDIEEYKPTPSTTAVNLDDYGYHYTADDKLTALMDRVTALESAALIESYFTVNEAEVEIPEK